MLHNQNLLKIRRNGLYFEELVSMVTSKKKFISYRLHCKQKYIRISTELLKRVSKLF